MRPVTVEYTYGLERIAMYLQAVDSMYSVWSQWKRTTASSP